MIKCHGCGIPLQEDEQNKVGYTQNIENNLCERCFRLKNYGEYQSVPLNNQDYQKIINQIPKNSLVVFTSDVLSINLSTIPNFPNMLLVLTKRDILPKSVKEEKIISQIKKQYPNFLDVLCISSLKNYSLDKLYQTLIKLSNNQPIYLIGYTNSGKSTLINKLIKNYSPQEDQPLITESMYPSTTLDKVEIKLENLTIIDTPGLIEDGSYLNILSKADLKKITPKKEIKPRSCQVKNQGSLLIGTYARIDYQTKYPNSFVIYTSQLVTSNFISSQNNTLKEFNPHKYSLKNNQDIVLPGLGFIKFTQEMEVTIYTPNQVEPYLRNNLI